MLIAAVRQRQHRQTTNQKVVQKGGVITTRGARAAIDARIKAEAQKASRATVRKFKQDAQSAATEALKQGAQLLKLQSRERLYSYSGQILYYYNTNNRVNS